MTSFFLPQEDLQQQVYGLPDYLGSLQSSLLNRDATLFRRRYYKNGAHMGFIFYATDPNLSDDDEQMLKEKIASSKGWVTLEVCLLIFQAVQKKGFS